jgi:hypothetical protein
VTVGVQPDAEHYCFAFFLLRRVRHEFKLRAVTLMVKRYQSPGLRPHQERPP